MERINDFLLLLDRYLGSAQWFVFVLLGTGLFFTIYLGFPQIRYFRHAFHVLTGRYDHRDHVGDTSHFQSLATALSGTVGTGNIAGVALAIHLGGPAAMFWMLVSAFLGMTTKFVEVSLSHKYREIDGKGNIAGGPMYYMKNRMNAKWLAAFFAVATIFSAFGTGCFPQVNSIATSMNQTFGLPAMLTGGVMAGVMALIIIGGIKRIAKVTSLLMPFMSIIYVIGALLVIFFNYENIIPSFCSIFENVFTGTAATGGFLGAGFAFAFNRGVTRGLFSNEAGQGSAPIAHAAARTPEPVSEGVVALLEPFIDTIVICFITGMTLLTSGVWQEKQENRFQMADLEVMTVEYSENNATDVTALYKHLAKSDRLPLFTGELHVEQGRIIDPVSIIHCRSLAENVLITKDDSPYNGIVAVAKGKIKTPLLVISGSSLVHSAALSTVAFTQSIIGDWGRYIVAFSLLLFAFSTAVAWSYYGDRAVTYLGGVKLVTPFRIIFCIGFFIASFTDTTIVWNVSSVTIVLMTLPNLIGILVLHKEMRQMENSYRGKRKKINEKK